MRIDQDGAARAQAKRICGPLARHIDGFVALLAREAYAPATLGAKRRLIVDLSCWLRRSKLPLELLDEERLRQFLIDRYRRFKRRNGDIQTTRRLLGYLRDINCIPVPRAKIDRTSLGRLTRDFERFLSSERCLARSTLVDYLRTVRSFLIDRFDDKALQLNFLRPTDIHHFIVGNLKTCSRSKAKATVAALRSFTRFLHQRGLIALDLAAAVPGVADWRSSHLPKSLPPKKIKQLLASCNRNTLAGRRDYAILLLMARLGLRAGEVVGMTLDDLDWKCGEIVVHGKGQQEARLPLPTDVGTALVSYLRHTRPACSTRRVFVRMRVPYRGLGGHSTVCRIVVRALKRAGLNVEFKGAHLFRHSLATNLLRRGATLTEIGQLLRHKDLTTTQIYAKVNIAALRTIALPWPRGAL